MVCLGCMSASSCRIRCCVAWVQLLSSNVLRPGPQLRLNSRILVYSRAECALRVWRKFSLALRSAEVLAIFLNRSRALLHPRLVFHRTDRCICWTLMGWLSEVARLISRRLLCATCCRLSKHVRSQVILTMRKSASPTPHRCRSCWLLVLCHVALTLLGGDKWHGGCFIVAMNFESWVWRLCELCELACGRGLRQLVGSLCFLGRGNGLIQETILSGSHS